MNMKSTRLIMGMPITVEIAAAAAAADLAAVFEYFEFVDKKFSTYKADSETNKINSGKIVEKDYSAEMKQVLKLSEETKKLTKGYFDVRRPDGKLDPSGLVKGWAIFNAAEILRNRGFKNFYIEAGGDIEARGYNEQHQKWSVGIRNPFKPMEIVKVVHISNRGLATSGSYERGDHIYNPHQPQKNITDIVSLTVIGPNVYEADRFATAAFAMGKQGINFIESQENLEGYMIDKEGIATMTSGFEKYTREVNINEQK